MVVLVVRGMVGALALGVRLALSSHLTAIGFMKAVEAPPPRAALHAEVLVIRHRNVSRLRRCSVNLLSSKSFPGVPSLDPIISLSVSSGIVPLPPARDPAPFTTHLITAALSVFHPPMALSHAQATRPVSPLCPKLFAKALDAHGLCSRYPDLVNKIITGFDIGKNMPTLFATHTPRNHAHSNSDCDEIGRASCRERVSKQV